MKNCAVLIDIESLVGEEGYRLENFSLRRIFRELKKMGYQEFAVKRAYGDWSHPSLNSIKREIVELGIEPVQIYGFHKGAHKNATDIHLAIDGMELLYTRLFIENFIIVSLDGKFEILAKKLNERGKRVIGVASKGAPLLFKRVCDRFIPIEITIENQILEDRLAPFSDLSREKRIALLQNSLLKEIILNLDRTNPKDWEEIKESAISALDFISQLPAGTKSLEKGLNISIFKLLLEYLFKNFDYHQWGFNSYPNFLLSLFQETPYKLVFKKPSDYRILERERNLPGYSELEPPHRTSASKLSDRNDPLKRVTSFLMGDPDE